jgi:polysaccharide export outer membrane protein
LAPGNYFGKSNSSNIDLPIQKNGKLIQENIEVEEITAELIIKIVQSSNGLETDKSSRTREQHSRYKIPNNRDYKLGPGDIISIIVWDHPELTTPAGTFRSAEQAGTVIAEDGTIYFPYVGTLNVAGLTTRDVRTTLTEKLSEYIENVQLDVRIAQFRSKRIYVVGEVLNPGLYEITDIPMTVLEAVNRAGGFTENADYSRALLTRDGATYRVDIQMIYEEGALEQNALLESGDILNISDRNYNKIFVIGEVNSPGSQIMNKGRSTLAEALVDAGFINQDKANPRFIYVMRGNSDVPKIFHLNALAPDALLLADRFPLYPRDIVYVDAAEIVRWNRVISNILSTSYFLNQTSSTRYPLFNARQ